jgi:hypothetical protein
MNSFDASQEAGDFFYKTAGKGALNNQERAANRVRPRPFHKEAQA